MTLKFFKDIDLWIQIKLMFEKKRSRITVMHFLSIGIFKTFNSYYFIQWKNINTCVFCFVWFNTMQEQFAENCTYNVLLFAIVIIVRLLHKRVLSFCIGYCYGSEETGCVDTLQQSQPTHSFLVFVEGLKGAWSLLLVKGLYCKVWPWMAVPFTRTGVLLCFWFWTNF